MIVRSGRHDDCEVFVRNPSALRPHPPASPPIPVGSLSASDPRSMVQRMKQVGPKFRETLWFKRGELDAEREATMTETADDEPSAVMLPIEDRYLDDGSVSATDTATFGLHVGGSQYVPVLRVEGEPDAHVVNALVNEMKRGRRKVLATMGASFVAAGALIFMYFM